MTILRDNQLKMNKKMQGYVIGNGVTAEQKYDGNALLPFAHGMALISDDLYRVSLPNPLVITIPPYLYVYFTTKFGTKVLIACQNMSFLYELHLWYDWLNEVWRK